LVKLLNIRLMIKAISTFIRGWSEYVTLSWSSGVSNFVAPYPTCHSHDLNLAASVVSNLVTRVCRTFGKKIVLDG
jgi:hypothetical protein